MPYSLKYFWASGFDVVLIAEHLDSMLLSYDLQKCFVFDQEHSSLNDYLGVYIANIVGEVISSCIITHDVLLKVTVSYKLFKFPS